MPTYLVLVNYTDQGIANVKDTITRTDHVMSEASSAKGDSEVKTENPGP